MYYSSGVPLSHPFHLHHSNTFDPIILVYIKHAYTTPPHLTLPDHQIQPNFYCKQFSHSSAVNCAFGALTLLAGRQEENPAPLKLRPYGAIQICLLLLLLLLFKN